MKNNHPFPPLPGGEGVGVLSGQQVRWGEGEQTQWGEGVQLQGRAYQSELAL